MLRRSERIRRARGVKKREKVVRFEVRLPGDETPVPPAAPGEAIITVRLADDLAPHNREPAPGRTRANPTPTGDVKRTMETRAVIQSSAAKQERDNERGTGTVE